MLIDISGRNVQIIYEPKQKGEIERNYSDITKARKMLGYEPQVELKVGLHALWKWYAEVGM